ncbi:MAG: DUF5671 domain-containing protein [Bryobacteraceae bacterium]|nr:DUF5671 domain-containing protein [Bryobacteraceae bacterium]
MDAPSIAAFLSAAKEKGASDELVMALLKERGWPEKEIYAAVARYYEERTGLAIPVRHGVSESAKDAFLYLLSFSTLATWTFALAALLFELIHAYFPDRTFENPYRFQLVNISGQLAAIIVAFPIYAWVMAMIGRDLDRSPAKALSSVRRWLCYLALLIAAGFVVGDLITFLNYFLRGELTVRFVLKVLTVLAIAGGVFWYYFSSLKEDEALRESAAA